jgi:hypothetical protein
MALAVLPGNIAGVTELMKAIYKADLIATKKEAALLGDPMEVAKKGLNKYLTALREEIAFPPALEKLYKELIKASFPDKKLMAKDIWQLAVADPALGLTKEQSPEERLKNDRYKTLAQIYIAVFALGLSDTSENWQKIDLEEGLSPKHINDKIDLIKAKLPPEGLVPLWQELFEGGWKGKEKKEEAKKEEKREEKKEKEEKETLENKLANFSASLEKLSPK